MQPLPTIKDIEGIITTPWPTVLKYLLFFLALGVLIAIFFLIKRKRQNKNDIHLSPKERALLELERLEKQKFIEKKEWQKFYSFLHEIFISYLTENFKIDILDKTTEEMKNIPELFTHIFSTTKDIEMFFKFLERSDTIRFGKLESSDAECSEELNRIKSFIKNPTTTET